MEALFEAYNVDLNAGYCWPHWPCCFSMIRTEEREALVVKE